MNVVNSFIEEQVQKRMVLDNPWWESGKIDEDFIQFPRRAYLNDFDGAAPCGKNGHDLSFHRPVNLFRS